MIFQEAANRYFQQIYARCDSMTIQDFINKLKAFKSSPDQRDKDILTCIIKNLFDEYRFFHEYPGRELKTTAELYGGIIREGIVANIQFAIALRRVIESLQSEMGSTLWNFGVVALNACRACLFRYPKVCQMLKNVSSFERFPAPLKEYIVHGEQNQLPPSHIPEEETEKSVAAQSTTPASNFKVPNRGVCTSFGTITFVMLTFAMSLSPPNFRHFRVNKHIYCKSGNSIILLQKVKFHCTIFKLPEFQ
jgi:CCR4-NOT transcription complex subunit 1